MKKSVQHHYQLRVSDEHYRRLRMLSGLCNETITDIVERALDEDFERRKDDIQKKFDNTMAKNKTT